MADIRPGDKLVSKKNHPCGGNVWTVLRSGADVKVTCDKCGRLVEMQRIKAEKFFKTAE